MRKPFYFLLLLGVFNSCAVSEPSQEISGIYVVQTKLTISENGVLLSKEESSSKMYEMYNDGLNYYFEPYRGLKESLIPFTTQGASFSHIQIEKVETCNGRFHLLGKVNEDRLDFTLSKRIVCGGSELYVVLTGVGERQKAE